MITNVILSAMMWWQVATNWGALTTVDSSPKFYIALPNSFNVTTLQYNTTAPQYSMVGTVVSQQLVVITLPDTHVFTNIVREIVLYTVVRYGHQSTSIGWYAITTNTCSLPQPKHTAWTNEPVGSIQSRFLPQSGQGGGSLSRSIVKRSFCTGFGAVLYVVFFLAMLFLLVSELFSPTLR